MVHFRLTPLEVGFELYRHSDTEKMKAKKWHGYCWARRTEEGDYTRIAPFPRRWVNPPPQVAPSRGKVR
jgi:hypothetical protein